MQPPSQKSRYDTAQRAAQKLRGEVIDLFAQVEYAINAVLVHAAALPEYKTLKPAFPRLLGQKLERLRQLKTEAGPLRSHANGVAPLVDKLAPFEDLRHFMAHVARLNIEHYRKLVATEPDETKQQTLIRLQAEEESKLTASLRRYAGEMNRMAHSYFQNQLNGVTAHRSKAREFGWLLRPSDEDA